MSDYLDPNNEELLKDFFAEAEQQVDNLESNVLVIENDPTNHEAIDEIFRAAHTLKGGSATVEMNEIASFTHSVEDMLDEIRSDRLKVTEPVIDVLLNAIDVIKAMLEARTNGSVYSKNIDDLINTIRSYSSGKGGKASAVKSASKTAASKKAPPKAESPTPAVSADMGFVRPELSVKWKLRLPPLGTSFIDFNAGTVIGKVPYPYLHLFPGNSTYILDKSAFSCMNYFEFAADKWTTLMWNHCFNGFFLGKIPGIRGLQMREELTVKLAYGTLSDKNNGVLPPGRNPAQDKFLFPPHGNNSLHGEPPFPPHGGNRIRENAPVSTYRGAYMAFPQGMQSLNGVPYIELGAGISNIFRVFRIDCFWRLTHRDKLLPDGRHTPAQNFRANIGIELRF